MNHRFTKPGAPSAQRIIRYETQGPVRSVSFILQDGTQRFLSYANLVDGDYRPEEGILVLTFTTQIVTLKGRALSSLIEDFASQTIRSITAVEARYADIEETGTLVTQISVKGV